MSDEKRCRDCCHFKEWPRLYNPKDKEAKYGDCRLHPKIYSYTSSSGMTQRFPTVLETDYCDAFQKQAKEGAKE